MTQKIAITGATGIVGKRLVSELLLGNNFQVRILTRDKERVLHEESFGKDVEIFEGDVSDEISLLNFIVPNCIVINLLYLRDAGENENLSCLHSLMAVCKQKKIARFVHCSTTDVIGRVSEDDVDESTPCRPIDEYGSTKFKLEHAVIDLSKGNFDSVILRPSAVFGKGGVQLKKLANDLVFGKPWRNYLRSCLFGNRRMNLVHVANVSAALIFLSRYSAPFEGSVFIVSDDDDVQNNFVDVERFMTNALGIKDCFWPRLPVPLIALKTLLRLMGRNNINPLRKFIPYKLRKIGFKPPVRLADGLAEYTDWYRRTILADVLTKSEPVISVKSGTQGNHES